MFAWLNQVLAVASYSVRTIPERLGASLSAAVGIAGVVTVLVGMLSIAEGFKKAMARAGAEDVAIVLRSGADSELTSNLSREETRLIADAPGIARDAAGALVSSELFVIINLPKRTTGTDANVPLRGLDLAAFAIRKEVKIVQGRRFEPGKNEIIVGTGAAAAFSGLDLGRSIKVGLNTWEVVGVFTSDGSTAESEIWTDAAVLQPAYHRGTTYQSVYARLTSASTFESFKDALTMNPQLKVKVLRLSEFYAEQSELFAKFVTGMGTFIAAMMALGAVFGALNTMYGAISARTREIATLRALGFSSAPVILSILAESLALALLGGVVGACLAYIAFNGMQTSTMNWQTFSQVTFAFAVTPALLIQAIIWAAALGLIGGLFPAIRAARLPIAAGLRES